MADRLAQKILHTRETIDKYTSDENLSKEVLNKEICSLWEWILFFQHERLIHIIILIGFSILTFLSFSIFLITGFLPVTVLFVLFLVLLIPYIFHYRRLENGVQSLYDLYDQLKALRED